MGWYPRIRTSNFDRIFRLRWWRIWRLKPDPITYLACSASGRSGKFYLRYFVCKKFKVGIKVLAETIWARLWKDLVGMTPNKEVMMSIAKHMENIISMFRFLKFSIFKRARFHELFILGSSPGLLVSEILDCFLTDCPLAKKCHFFEKLSWLIFT